MIHKYIFYTKKESLDLSLKVYMYVFLYVYVLLLRLDNCLYLHTFCLPSVGYTLKHYLYKQKEITFYKFVLFNFYDIYNNKCSCITFNLIIFFINYFKIIFISNDFVI